MSEANQDVRPARRRGIRKGQAWAPTSDGPARGPVSMRTPPNEPMLLTVAGAPAADGHDVRGRQERVRLPAASLRALTSLHWNHGAMEARCRR